MTLARLVCPSAPNRGLWDGSEFRNKKEAGGVNMAARLFFARCAELRLRLARVLFAATTNAGQRRWRRRCHWCKGAGLA